MAFFSQNILNQIQAKAGQSVAPTAVPETAATASSSAMLPPANYQDARNAFQQQQDAQNAQDPFGNIRAAVIGNDQFGQQFGYAADAEAFNEFYNQNYGPDAPYAIAPDGTQFVRLPQQPGDTGGLPTPLPNPPLDSNFSVFETTKNYRPTPLPSPKEGSYFGAFEASTQQLVYGPDGTVYSNPGAAQAAGVTNYTNTPPQQVPITGTTNPVNFNTNPSNAEGIMGLFNSPGLKSVPESANQQTISPYAQPYVADLLGKAQAFTGTPMPSYKGQLTAGYSPLQEQAYAGLANLTIPTSLETAGANLQDISQKQQNLSFSPVDFTNAYQAPNSYQGITALNQFTPTSAYAGANIQNQYTGAASGFRPTDVTTSQFNQQAAQQYMNPYIQTALNPQLEALKRQSDINRQGELAKLTQAGAFGGSREAILRGQQDYNLLQQQSGLIGSGYNQAYNQAAQQFSADQARALQAQQINVDQAKYAAQLGMTDAQLTAQYGMTAAQANEASRQFSQQQDMQNAANRAQYGSSAQAANIQQGQFGYSQDMDIAKQRAQSLQQQQAAQQSAKQFGATYGLQGLQAAASSQQAAANAGASSAQYGLANLQALSKAGTEQQAIAQQALNAQYNEYLRQLKYPETMLKLQRDIITGLPMTQTNTFQAQKSVAQSAAGAMKSVSGIVDELKKQGMKMPDISKYINQLTKSSPAQTGGITIDESGNYIYPVSPEGATPYDEDGNLMPGFGYTEDNNPVYIGNDYIDPSISYPDYGSDDYSNYEDYQP